ncbi:amidohydrolase family protein [Ulvibacter sp. MAR_2010_11]|uniref:amidohydrolase family protein n=1 Tax=Ulvibacter sp. MAR_2010_11 TaxID=1250229 RepID=UPI000C2B731C|nr:amidohydrolase family protein [Ulvibacter sp. MAR_2010_11]PKA84406.1 amidohydrolase family protein [Ulvibacter sp. MAR_2010_11]
MKFKYSLLRTLVVLLALNATAQKIFDTHIHGTADPIQQLQTLALAGVYEVALSTSWDAQTLYKDTNGIKVLQGLMLACPNGKVPYSNQYCFADQGDFPDVTWVEQLIKEHKIHFIGEVLSQYYGISSSDERLIPYYALAEKYGIPVGIHSGLAGPDHGAPNFKVSLGTPLLLEDMLQRFPKLKVWIMHAGAPFLEDTLAILKYYPNVYLDISAVNNPYIFPKADFQAIIKRFIDGGFEDRIMFGSDNGPINLAIENVEQIDFISSLQKEKIFYRNAEVFFSRENK